MQTVRRVVDFAISECDVLAAFERAQTDSLPTCFVLPRYDPPLPPDGRVVAVIHDVYRRDFVFRVEHAGFAEVPAGSLPRQATTRFETADTDSPTVLRQ